MRYPLLAALVLGPAAGLLMGNAGVFSATTPIPASPAAAPKARPCDSKCSPDWLDANLRLNQLQMVGTSVSAKLRPESGVLTVVRMGGGRAEAESLDFGQPTLAAQLDADVRALSFDVQHDPNGGAFRNPAIAGMGMVLLPADFRATMQKPGFKVLHVPDVDYRSSCLTLKDCLGQVAAWSKAHPRHLPILITLRPNDQKTAMPGAVKPPAIDGAALSALEREVRAVFAPEQIITPAMVRGRHAGLRQAIQAEGWPKLGAVRGKVMFVLDGKSAARYRGGLMFAAGDRPNNAIVLVNDPVREGAHIAAALQAGQLVMTRADEQTQEARSNDVTRRDAAFASGAQIVLTDFAVSDPAIGPYRVSLADQRDARCGKMLGTENCIRVLETPLAVMASLP
jgi:hypothetical protein